MAYIYIIIHTYIYIYTYIYNIWSEKKICWFADLKKWDHGSASPGAPEVPKGPQPPWCEAQPTNVEILNFRDGKNMKKIGVLLMVNELWLMGKLFIYG